MRVCPALSLGVLNPIQQINIEYRAADATANAYIVLARLIYSGLIGIQKDIRLPPLNTKTPAEMADSERQYYYLRRLSQSLEGALLSLEADPIMLSWLPPPLLETFFGRETL